MKKTKKPNNNRLKIAIIGAPNVGKSTFLNKILGGRRSIVEDIPGITRDRIYADTDLGRFAQTSLPVTLIDTGGLFFKEDILFAGVQKQAELAMEEADLVLLMVDGRVGLTSTDRQIAKIIRSQGKPHLLLVNKLDSDHHTNLKDEFYKLGLAEPISFSSLGENFGISVENLIQKIQELNFSVNLEQIQPIDRPEEIVKVAILGKPNVGKSSLLNQLVGYQRSLVHDQAGTTRDALDTGFIYQGRPFLLIDTAGLRRKSKVYGSLERFAIDRSIKAMVRADIAILVIDATQGITHQEQKLAALIQRRYKGCILVLNKWDLIEKNQHSFEEYQNKLRCDLHFVNYAPIVICSAKTGQRVTNILDACLTVHSNLQKRVRTGLFNVVLREIVACHEPARAGAKNLRIYYGTQAAVNPPTFAVFVNQPQKFNLNYQKFLERSIRQEFGFEGAPLKLVIKESTGKEKK